MFLFARAEMNRMRRRLLLLQSRKRRREPFGLARHLSLSAASNFLRVITIMGLTTMEVAFCAPSAAGIVGNSNVKCPRGRKKTLVGKV